MKTTTLYKCNGITEATDRANLYYIASPTADRITKDTTARTITIMHKARPLAVFQY